MSDIKLFRIQGDAVEQLQGSSVAIEASLQELIERHLEALLGVRFLAHEYQTGKTHGGRIDTLGIDENGSPVIIEYKRALNQNVINQGLYYLDWLLDHKGELKLLVLDRLGTDAAKGVDWRAPRLLCIANDFTKYDEHAIGQMNRSIELVRYRRYGDELLLFELVNATVAPAAEGAGDGATPPPQKGPVKGITAYKTVSEALSQATAAQRDRFEALKAFLLALGDDVQVKTLKYYIAFRRIKNFACVEVRTQSENIVIYVKVDPASKALEQGFTRDVRTIGHYGTGDLEITIRTDADLERAKPLLLQSYEAS
jgi:predicted transport protein